MNDFNKINNNIAITTYCLCIEIVSLFNQDREIVIKYKFSRVNVLLICAKSTGDFEGSPVVSPRLFSSGIE